MAGQYAFGRTSMMRALAPTFRKAGQRGVLSMSVGPGILPVNSTRKLPENRP
jgi:hypothetical protein